MSTLKGTYLKHAKKKLYTYNVYKYILYICVREHIKALVYLYVFVKKEDKSYHCSCSGF